MKGIIKPRGGRPSKVTKPSAPRRPSPRHAQLLEGHRDEHEFDEHDADVADAEAEADIDDDDHAAAAGSHVQNIDLNTAANILANGGAGQPPAALMGPQDQAGLAHGMQVAAQMGGHNMDPSIVKKTDELARESGYDNFVVESALAKRLARDPGLRLAHQRRPEQQLNLGRRSNVEALFAHIAGEMAPAPCKNCHKGHGPWNCCVVVDGQMCGSCANCWFNASGARCSFHETRNPQPQLHHHPALLASSSTASVPPDASTSFGLSQSMAMAPPPPALQNLNIGMSFTNDPLARYTIDRALAEVRAADKKTREIIAIEVKTKQLALQIVEYEEAVRDEPAGGPHSGGVLGDEEAA